MYSYIYIIHREKKQINLDFFFFVVCNIYFFVFLHTVRCYSETIPLRKCAHYYFYLMKELKRQSLSLRQLRTAFLLPKQVQKWIRFKCLGQEKAAVRKKCSLFRFLPMLQHGQKTSQEPLTFQKHKHSKQHIQEVSLSYRTHKKS